MSQVRAVCFSMPGEGDYSKKNSQGAGWLDALHYTNRYK